LINYNQLRIFYHAAKNLSFTAAAGELFLTQPAITAQIKAFEAYCGMKLFIKKGRSIHLTEQGRALFDYARQVFEYEKKIENVIEEMKEVKRGVLRLGTTKAYARYFMPFLISSFHKDYPHIKIHLDEGSSRDMINSLVDLKNEVAVIAKAADNPKVTFVPFSQEELVVILPVATSIDAQSGQIEQVTKPSGGSAARCSASGPWPAAMSSITPRRASSM